MDLRAFFVFRMRIFASISIVVLLLCGCGTNANKADRATAGRTFTDGLGRTVVLPERIDRAVSLAPSVTEMIFAAGAGDRLVGVTTYCDFPEAAKQIKKIGDTQTPNIEVIAALRPQVVLVTTASQIQGFMSKLESQNIAIFVTDPKSVASVEENLRQLGEIFGTQTTANAEADKLADRLAVLEKASLGATRPKTFVQISKEPLYTAGEGSYLTELIAVAGGDSVTKNVPTAFPKLSKETALAMNPDVIILSASEDNTAPNEAFRNSPAVKNGRVYSINADIIARPGPRMADAAEQMAKMLHPEIFGVK